MEEIVLGNVMVDCDDKKKLQRFYGELLGWEMCEHFVTMIDPAGHPFCLCKK